MSAPPAGISIREFARRDGCSDKLVRRAVENGRLLPFPDGTLDPALVGTGWREGNRRAADTPADTGADTRADGADIPRPVRTPRPSVARPEPSPPAIPRSDVAEGRQAPFEALGAADDADPEDVVASADHFAAQVLAGRYVSLAQAERVKENALALKHVLDARQRAGSLVETAAAEAVLFETARAARDSWLNWPARVGPLVAADLGIEADRAVEVLTRHVHDHLAELGEPEADFAGGA